MNIGIIGLGRWGRNLLRIFDELVNVKLCVHNGNPDTQDWIKNNYPDQSISLDYFDILNDDSIDAIVIATPINSHYQIAKDALNAGKHVFVEKPITMNSEQAKILVDLAGKRILFVGHIFLLKIFLRELYAKFLNGQEFRMDKNFCG